MKIDGNQLNPKDLIIADICIIGAGAAGITIAREFIGTNKKVYLLEAGGYQEDPNFGDFYGSESVDFKPNHLFDPDYTKWSRVRYFGGSTNRWGGWSRPMESYDFEDRSWVQNSGWPFKRQDIESHYHRACDLIQIPRYDFNNETESSVAKPSQDYDTLFAKAKNNKEVEERFFTFSPPTKFGEVYGEELHQAPNIFVVTNASVTRMDCMESGERLSQIEFINKKLDKFLVRSQIFILASGGLENPRLLLNSNHQYSNGLGNEYDQVGRYFMEHPHVEYAFLMNNQGEDWTQSFNAKSPTDVRRIFTTSFDFQKQRQLMNYSCQMTTVQASLPHAGEIAEVLKVSQDVAQASTYLRLYCRTEMAPNPKNRVTLGADRDPYGLRRMKVELEYTQEDLTTVRESTTAVIRHLSALNTGRGQFVNTDKYTWTPVTTGACHHMGTTRMSKDPQKGVVDEYCRVHGIENLVVAGSSVFPTGGFANPTLTLVALAVKTAEDIKKGSIQ